MDTSIREVTSQATIEEKKKLRKELRLFDLIFFTAAAIIGIDTLGAVSSNGGQALTWILISAVTFLMPYGLLTAELGSTFTQEGGIYEWCKMAGGRFFASLAAMLYWISNPLWIGGTLSVTAIIAIKTLAFGNPNFVFGGNVLIDSIVSILIALAFIWGTVAAAIMSLHSGKLLSVYGSYVKLALFALFIILALVFAFSGHATGAHVALPDLVPSFGIAIAILPVLIFNWVGFELQNGAGEEMTNPKRDVPISVARSGLLAVLGYGLVIATILFTLSKDQLSNAGGFLSAFQLVDSVLPGPVAYILGFLVMLGVILALASSGGTWIIGSDRCYAIAALDRTAPAILGRFSSRYGTPMAVNLMSGIVASITVIASVVLTAANGGSAPALFGLVIGFTVSTTTLSYLFIFPTYLILRYKYPNVRRPYVVPGGIVGAWIATLLPLAYAVVASWFILFPRADDKGAVGGIPWGTYVTTQFVTLGIIVLLTVVFYVWGHAEKRNRDVVIEFDFSSDEGLTSREIGLSAGDD